MRMSELNPAEKHVNEAQKEQALAAMQKIGTAVKGMTAGRYTPVGKSLTDLGIEPKIMDIMIADEPVECMVIPLKELIYKEWFKMSGGINKSEDEESTE
jgi:isocitrate dehydrogenase